MSTRTAFEITPVPRRLRWLRIATMGRSRRRDLRRPDPGDRRSSHRPSSRPASVVLATALLAAAGCRSETTSQPVQGPFPAGEAPTSARSSPARFLVAAGDAALEEGRLEDARRHYEKAATLARGSSERAEEILALNQLGILAERRGALEDAADHYQRALDLQQVAGEGPGETLLRSNLARVQMRLGDGTLAEAEATHAIERARPLEDPGSAAVAYRELGRVLRAQHRDAEARGALSSAAELFARAGWHDQESSVRLELGRACIDCGDARHAVAELSRALRGKDGVAAMRLMADAYEAMKEPKNALTFRERALEQARRSGGDDLATLLDEAIASARKVDRPDLVATWTSERDALTPTAER